MRMFHDVTISIACHSESARGGRATVSLALLGPPRRVALRMTRQILRLAKGGLRMILHPPRRLKNHFTRSIRLTKTPSGVTIR